MTASLAELAPKLDPLIRRLATDHDGERLATVAALERMLVASKATFHDLADAVVAGTRPPKVIVIERPSQPAANEPPDDLGMTTALNGRIELNAWEVQFVGGCRRQLLRGRQGAGVAGDGFDWRRQVDRR